MATLKIIVFVIFALITLFIGWLAYKHINQVIRDINAEGEEKIRLLNELRTKLFDL